MNTEERFALLSDLKAYIETRAFQEFIMKPLYDELGKLKGAYECKTLGELNAVKGEAKGLKKLIGLLKQVEVDWKNDKYELEK